MDWNAIGAIGEAVSAVVVVVTLFYLIVQLRQNTEALRSNAYQSVHDAEIELFRDLSKHQELRDLYFKAQGGLDVLDDKEREQWSWLSRQHIFLFQNVHYQWSKGAMDEDMWRVWGAALGDSLLNHKGIRQMTRVLSPYLRPAFVEYVNTYVPVEVGRVNNADLSNS